MWFAGKCQEKDCSRCPDGAGLPIWTQYTKESPLTMSIRSAEDCEMRDRSVPEIEKLADVYMHWKTEAPQAAYGHP